MENDLYTAGGMDPLHFKCALLEEKKDLHFVIGLLSIVGCEKGM